jgi:hypothetical protein
MGLVVSGMLNKQIASEIGASEATVKIHRGNLMQKMQAGSLIELVGIYQWQSGPDRDLTSLGSYLPGMTEPAVLWASGPMSERRS